MSLDFSLEEEITEIKEVFDGNVTSNLVPMWVKAGIYESLYESKGKHAKTIIDPLEHAIKDMEENPEDYKLLNPQNGWGDYYSALKWIKDLLSAAKEHPDSVINSWH
jgi:hypothetical protein